MSLPVIVSFRTGMMIKDTFAMVTCFICHGDVLQPSFQHMQRKCGVWGPGEAA